ncbi:aromatase/cyclase [Streptomyces sp. NRRL F-5126]|uniref:aromatase/cyclase n=1 Tax=Streptomyces sp. NRRL F-5126 TaxID=1463857 RepID=UPI00068C0F1D|nr:aromatase/cyclase [Streptomyces sp. NRRL F-5126]
MSTASAVSRAPEPPVRTTVHSTDVAAPAAAVYAVVADVTTWPQYFTPNVHVEHLERGERSERLRIWATANGEVKTWVSRRELDPEALRVTFRQEVSTPPVAAMGGTWAVTATGPSTSRLDLHHDFSAVDDTPENVAWITSALDRNSAAELAGIKEVAEQADLMAELVFGFEDTVHVEGEGTGPDVFDFLNRSDLWPERLPHVARLDLREEVPGLQVMAMDTTTADGSTHTTESVRVVFGRDRIVYKQTTVPALMSAHTGQWTVTPVPGGVDVTSRHTVTVRTDTIERILGAGTGVAEAREFIHRALSTNSSTTLRYAKEFAEARRG